MNIFKIEYATDDENKELSEKEIIDILSGYDDSELLMLGRLNNKKTFCILSDLLNNYNEVKVISKKGEEFIYESNRN